MCWLIWMNRDGSSTTMKLEASRTTKGVSTLMSGAIIMVSRPWFLSNCCVRHDGWAEFLTLIKHLHAEPLVLAYLRPSAFIGTPEILCLVFLRKRLVMRSILSVDSITNNSTQQLNWNEPVVEMEDGQRWRSGLRTAEYIARWVPLRSMRIFWTRDWVLNHYGLDP